jgi:hypothetical protein
VLRGHAQEPCEFGNLNSVFAILKRFYDLHVFFIPRGHRWARLNILATRSDSYISYPYS